MKKAFYSISTYLIASLLGISFYFMLFNIFQLNPVIGMAIVSFIALVVVTMVTDADFIQEIEE
ncbi:MAG: hypothetical protein AAF705_18670 [Bacteroidota bacterium]